MNEQVHTLVVDDEEMVRFFIQEALQKSGHIVTTASSGEEALDRLRDTAYDLVLVDLKLGGRVDGIRVLNAVRWRWPATTVVILTAHGSLGSAMAAIREGVDGYLLKPAEPEELRQIVDEALERRRGLMHAQQEAEQHILQHGPISVDLERHQVTLGDQSLDLTPHEFKLLVYLMENAHRVVTPRELVREVRQYESDNQYESRQIIKWYIHRLRQKLEPDPSNPRYILNVRGVGYSLGE
ncbi:MAG: response regulator transcription factor [Anaerolineae bacterium]